MRMQGAIQSTTAAESPEERYQEYLAELRKKLGILARDTQISETLARKGPHALYELLLRRRKVTRRTDEPLIEELVRQNHLFVIPVRKTPALMALNGTGVRIYSDGRAGSGDVSRVVTQFITLVYLPAFPVAQYLATPDPMGGWKILGRLPLRPSYRLWLGIGCVLTITAAILVAALCGMSMAGTSR